MSLDLLVKILDMLLKVVGIIAGLKTLLGIRKRKKSRNKGHKKNHRR